MYLSDKIVQAALHAVEFAPKDGQAHYQLAVAYYARCQLDLAQIEGEKALAFNPFNAEVLGNLGG